MGLFRDLGERVERFKQRAEDASREQAAYRCGDCGEPVYTDRETCPHCESEAVERVEDSSAAGENESAATGETTDGSPPTDPEN